MKAKNLGRLELLQWLNDATECDYPKIELCSDGIAYCQILDALHPGVVQLSKLNLNAKHKDDNARNLKVLDDAIHKLKLNKQIKIETLSNGKFQFNMDFIQWLYDYAQKVNPNVVYSGYERRVEAYKKQNGLASLQGIQIQMSPHLVPNKTSYRKMGQDIE